jgi:hypothetical protein
LLGSVPEIVSVKFTPAPRAVAVTTDCTKLVEVSGLPVNRLVEIPFASVNV